MIALPNAWRRDVLIEPGRPAVFPDPTRPECVLTLGGPPGVERVVAIVTREPLHVPLIPEGSGVFRTLLPDDLVALSSALEELDPTSWATARCDLTIQACYDRFSSPESH